MLTKRNYIVMLMLILMVFVMFMLVDLSAAYLTRDTVNPQASVPVTITRDRIMDAQTLAVSSPEAGERPRVAILVAADDTATRQVLTEWCVYNKCRCEIYTGVPDAADVAGCKAMLVGPGVAKKANLPALRACAQTGVDMVFTALPSVADLAASPDLADFFGIDEIRSEAQPYRGVYLFDGFFVGGARVYEEKDIYGEGDEDVFFTAPYYALRAGYLVFAQGLTENDADIRHEERPPLLWRTYTGKSNVYVNGSDLFSGKDLLGLVTAFLSQSGPYAIYPVVNAQTLSLVDYPMLASENTETLMAFYSRGADALGRDVLWPGVAKHLHGAAGRCSFFLAPELDPADGNGPSAEFVGFYRQEIEQVSGVLGLALNRVNPAALPEVLERSDAFLAEAMPGYDFTAAYATREQLAEMAQGELAAPLEHLTLLMTDAAADAPLLDFLNDRTLAVSFTTDGFFHESLDDLHLVCMQTALALDQQKVDMSLAYYPEEELAWNQLNELWSKGETYRKPFAAFDAMSVYEMEARVRTFLALDYTSSLEEGVITLTVEGHEGSSFILRLLNQRIDRVEGAALKRIADTAWLIKPEEREVRIHISPTNIVNGVPSLYREVIQP